MQKFRFHLLGLVHLPTSYKYLSCAFTCKNVKLARMLLSLGHEVYLYGAKSEEGPMPECTKFIETHTLRDIRNDYGDGDNRFEVGYDWTAHDFRHDFQTARKPATLKFYQSCIDAINADKRDDDFVLLTMGHYHLPIKNAVNLFLNCEPGIGYRGSGAARFRAFESAYMMNFAYGSENPFGSINGSHYDRVIPNYFDPDDITYSADKSDYYLFVGRMILRKGILEAALATEAIRHGEAAGGTLGARLVIAGQGAHVDRRGYLVPNDNREFELAPGNWEYIGFIGVDRRKELMAHAKATFCATQYLEPFAGVHVESMLSGTPVITSDFGVFPGTVEDGVDGYRCHTLDDFVWATQHVGELDPATIRRRAERYLMDNVKWEFQRWFEDLYDVYLSAGHGGKGWHHIRDEEPEWRRRLSRVPCH